MTTSSLRVSAPFVRSGSKSNGTRRAERFIETIREQSYRAAKTLPLFGGERAKRRKLDPTDVLRMSIDEAAEVLRAATDTDAVDLLRALATDAEKHERVDVSLNAIPRIETANVPAVEREFSVLFGRFLAAADDLVTVPHAPLARSLEARRLRNLEIGLEARARALMNMAERDDS